MPLLCNSGKCHFSCLYPGIGRHI